MPLPELTNDGFLPPGIYAASLREVLARHAVGSPVRQRQGELLRLLVEAAKTYPTIKRVLVWGSFVTDKTEPGDLDYSIVISINHGSEKVAPQHRRFFVPVEARQFYGVDRGYFYMEDWLPIIYAEKMLFLCETRGKTVCGVVEISLRGEVAEADTDAPDS